MQFPQACRAEFSSGDRARGEESRFGDRIRFLDIGHKGVRANASGSFGESYLVEIDLQDIAAGGLGVYCGCPRFADGFNCKHLWATIKKLDATVDLALPVTELSFYEIEPGEVTIGHPRQTRQASSPSKKAATRNSSNKRHVARAKSPSIRKAAKVTSSQPLWKHQLQRMQGNRFAGQKKVPSLSVLPGALTEEKHWFVFSIMGNSDQFSLVLMRSTRKADGSWGRPVAVQIDPQKQDTITLPEDRRAVSLLEPVQEYRSRSYHYSFRSEAATRLFQINPAILEETLHALAETKRLAWKLGDSQQHFEDAQPVQLVDLGAPWLLVFELNPDEEKNSNAVLSVALHRGGDVIGLDSVMWSNALGCALVQGESSTDSALDQEGAEECASTEASIQSPLANLSLGELAESEATICTKLVRVEPSHIPLLVSWQQTKKISVQKRSLPSLLEYLNENFSHIELQIAPALGVGSQTCIPQARCQLSQAEYKGTGFAASFQAIYAEKAIEMDSSRRWWFDRGSSQIYKRNLSHEEQWLQSLPADDFVVGHNRDFARELQLKPDRFLQVVSQLRDAGWEVVANGAAIKIASNFNISVTSGLDWFDLQANAEFDGSQASLPELLKALKAGERFVRLDDGTCGMLPEDWLKRFVDLHSRGEEMDGAIRFKKSQGLILDAMLEEHKDVVRDRNFNRFCTKLRSFTGVRPAEPPRTFSGDLREYQKLGLGWFNFLREFGFGGCLADDMGLGKTIQVLAMLDRRRTQRGSKSNPKQPMSMVVVPKSLIFNWMDEAAKFVPALKVMNYTGLDRRQLWDNRDSDPDLLLTTYGTIRNDIAFLREIKFDYLILDEAQAIKNPDSQAAKASRLLQGDHRLAMTGTPVENHLGDLWSIFDFLNPSMLAKSKGSAHKAATAYMESDSERQAVEQVGRALRPFILRRTKQQVLAELPDKVEQTLSCKMNGRQRKLYEQLREHYRLHLSNKVKELGLKKSKIHVLEALLRMRQVACDPRLVKPECGIRGAKLDSLLEQLGELVNEGHKVLIFSQFTKLLGLLRRDIDERSWQYEYLDGKTTNRAKCVQRFQDDEACKLFLISLKAGGNGLNLTAADYVFILDPWWNPAVEAQAIDRAHRLGQTKPVIAYRMICAGTVEEKIIQLQAAKRELADAIICQEKSLISDLTADDLQALLS
ncbi:MAG: DEAD/DEAH box helicase [Planctomycetales bacterium]|nr:DEAD/DEAH box helicase [Planctomycetales bacterium]